MTMRPRRLSVPLLLALTMLAASGAGTALGDDVPWFRRALVGMEVGPTGAQSGSDPSDVGYAADFNGREVVRRCAEAGSEYVVIWARDGEYAYYDSKVAAKCPGLGARDVLREAVEEGAARKLPIIAYCVVQQGGQYLSSHPEFAMRGADGAIIPGRFCLNSGYLETLKALTDEMIAYGVDGFHIDMIDQGFGAPYGCWCETCRKLFKAQYGTEPPAGATWDEGWGRMLEFRYESSRRFERALYDHVKKVKPGVTVDFNYHGNPPFSFEVGQRPVRHGENGDFLTGETGVWGFSALGVGLNAEFYRAATPGLPFQVAIQRGVRMYHDQTTRPLNDIRWELATLLAHGAFVTMVDKTGYDGRLDPVAYKRIGEAFRDANAGREHFGHRPVQEVAVYFSSRSRDWYGREHPDRYFRAFQGAHRALVLEHVPWGVALDENATDATLAAFPVVILPDAPVISAEEVARFRKYVEQGGSLIVTGWSGLLGDRGEPTDRSALEDLIGAKLVRRLDSRDNHVRLPAAMARFPFEPLLAGIEHDWSFLVEGPAAIYRPTTATPLGDLLEPHRTVRQKQGKEGTGWPLSAGKAVGPAILVNAVGKGRVLTFAASPDAATASEHPIVEARKLLVNAVRFLHPSPHFRVEAPAFVESVLTDDPETRTLRVHLIAGVSTPTTTPPTNRPYVIPGLIEDAPTFRARVVLSITPISVAAASPTTTTTLDGKTISAVVNDVHGVIVIRY
ncbi:MAG: beta-galactosidase trimerization domain-containing protein [Paludisphaera borealis]|uniref:beta-galactosidase trimerization domain-containing protein n=1 Tax=Paludisphaera borealis TaxID=1387353 RepID=UPI002847BF01|nr:beta-galactosidase trimerization domain-containing protein [Paludisphaera borealis]MDR3623170.1 beta-galactosidase trimerization domain-containing protein [Paludisphaera borealis]